MCSTYEMPTPTLPTDAEMDQLDGTAAKLTARVDVPSEARQVIRLQRDMIRRLRINQVKLEAQRDSIEAVAAIERDERVAKMCPGGLCWPLTRDKGTGRCPACNQVLTLTQGGTTPRHAVPTV